MFRTLQIAKMVGQVRFIPRRQQRGDQDQIGHTIGERGQRRVLRVGEDEVGPHAIPDDLSDDGGLLGIRLERQDERHRSTSSP